MKFITMAIISLFISGCVISRGNTEYSSHEFFLKWLEHNMDESGFIFDDVIEPFSKEETKLFNLKIEHFSAKLDDKYIREFKIGYSFSMHNYHAHSFLKRKTPKKIRDNLYAFLDGASLEAIPLELGIKNK